MTTFASLDRLEELLEQYLARQSPQPSLRQPQAQNNNFVTISPQLQPLPVLPSLPKETKTPVSVPPNPSIATVVKTLGNPLPPYELPAFSGKSEPSSWLEACVQLFRIYEVSENEMVDEAGFYLEDEAYVWFLDWENGRHPLPWDEFSRAILSRFGSSTPNTIPASLPLKISSLSSPISTALGRASSIAPQVFDRNPHPSLTLSTSLASTPFVVGCTNTFPQFVDFIFPPQPTTYLNGNYPSRIEPYENVNPKVASSSFEALLLSCTPLIKGGGELVFNRGGCVIALLGRDVKKWRLLSACGLIDYDISCGVSVEVQGRCNFLSFKEPYKELICAYQVFEESLASKLCVWKFISSLANRIELQFRNQQAVRIVKEFQLLNLEWGCELLDNHVEELRFYQWIGCYDVVFHGGDKLPNYKEPFKDLELAGQGTFTDGNDDLTAVSRNEVPFTLSLYPDGYSIGKASENDIVHRANLQDASKLLHPYDRASETIFVAIESGWLPGDILDDIPCKCINGTIICEVRDYRKCASEQGSDNSWTYGDLMEVESRIVKALQPVLSLDPKPKLDRLSASPLASKLNLNLVSLRRKRLRQMPNVTVTPTNRPHGKKVCIDQVPESSNSRFSDPNVMSGNMMQPHVQENLSAPNLGPGNMLGARSFVQDGSIQAFPLVSSQPRYQPAVQASINLVHGAGNSARATLIEDSIDYMMRWSVSLHLGHTHHLIDESLESSTVLQFVFSSSFTEMLQFKANVVCCFCLDIGLGTSRISRGREWCRLEDKSAFKGKGLFLPFLLYFSPFFFSTSPQFFFSSKSLSPLRLILTCRRIAQLVQSRQAKVRNVVASSSDIDAIVDEDVPD
ncbi:Protein PHYTOCHROME-DEPENDENT LATE-FLOWERING [Linum perenne]